MNIHVEKRGRGHHAMLKRKTRIKRRLQRLTQRARRYKAILLFALILVAAVAVVARQWPRQLAPPPPATDRMCQIIWESVGFFNRLDLQEMRASQFTHYNRACR